jgi:hypothetical protein
MVRKLTRGAVPPPSWPAAAEAYRAVMARSDGLVPPSLECVNLTQRERDPFQINAVHRREISERHLGARSCRFRICSQVGARRAANIAAQKARNVTPALTAWEYSHCWRNVFRAKGSARRNLPTRSGRQLPHRRSRPPRKQPDNGRKERDHAHSEGPQAARSRARDGGPIKHALYQRARAQEIEGRSKMTKQQLENALA